MDYKRITNNIRNELKDYILKNNLKSLVCGISGGIDSAVCVALAKPVCDELGIPLIGRSIPIETNKQDELDRAKMVGECFCTDFKEVDFGDVYEVFNDKICTVEGRDNSKIAKGNIKARIRMIYLYNLAGMNGGIVIGTSNYTEILLDFYTIGGDGCVDYELIFPLWKTEVYKLAEYLTNTPDEDFDVKGQIAIDESIAATPTDGLGISNSDVEQFGVNSYDEVDKILQDYIEYKDNRDTLSLDDPARIPDSLFYNLENHPVVQRYNKRFKHKLPISPSRIEYGLE